MEVALPYSIRSRQLERVRASPTASPTPSFAAFHPSSRSGSSFAPSDGRSPTSPSKTRSPRSASATPSPSCSPSVSRDGNGPPFGAILFFYWLAWALYPLPPANFDYAQVGVPHEWHSHLLQGFAAHWNKNANLGQAFDLWFLNLFPRTSPFLHNGGGYLTLSFIPTLGTMLLGLIAGQWLVAASPRIPFRADAHRGHRSGGRSCAASSPRH